MIMYYTVLSNITTRMLPSLAGFLLSGAVSANIIPSHGYTVRMAMALTDTFVKQVKLVKPTGNKHTDGEGMYRALARLYSVSRAAF